MRLLFVCPTYPLPLDTGSRVRWINLARKLTLLGHTVDVLCFATAEEETSTKTENSPFFRIESIRTGPDKPVMSLRDKLIRSAKVLPARLHGLPKFMAYAAHPEFKRRLTELTPEYDTIFIEMFFLATNLPPALLHSQLNKFVLVEHDISFIPFRRHYEVIRHSAGLGARLCAWWHYRGIRATEIKVLSQFRQIVAMSIVDAALLTDLAPGKKILLAPNGVDTKAIVPRDNKKSRTKPELLYVGGLRHRPNYDSIRHFLANILPEVIRTVPDVRLTVLGNTNGLDRELSSLAPDRVAFHGFVPNAEPYYDRCLALVVPLRIGSGTRLKILEAMAAGVPVITTSIGVEGIDATHDKTVLVANTPEEFSSAIHRLLTDQAHAARLAKASRSLCESRYDWLSITTALLAQLTLSPKETL